jgi:uncharacterized protein YdhG (YjbR/CyaY superfamily)
MHSDAATVEKYLAALQPQQRVILSAVRQTVLANLHEGFQESMRWGMPTYEVPLERFPDTYNAQPLAYVSFAVQKRHYSLYLMGLEADSELEQDFIARWNGRGRRLDMGKSCVRFKKLEDLDLELVGEAVAAMTVDDFIAVYGRTRGR